MVISWGWRHYSLGTSLLVNYDVVPLVEGASFTVLATHPDLHNTQGSSSLESFADGHLHSNAHICKRGGIPGGYAGESRGMKIAWFTAQCCEEIRMILHAKLYHHLSYQMTTAM